jgi:hypothetical protein
MLYMAVVAAVVVVLAAVEKEDEIPMSYLILSRLFFQIAFKLNAVKSPSCTELQERISSMCRLNK